MAVDRSETSIANAALRLLKSTSVISDLRTDQNKLAKDMRAWYDEVLEFLLGDHSWRFASKTAELALVEEEPNDEWGFSYREPSDCLRRRRIQNGLREEQETEDTKVPFAVSSDDDGVLIFTDQEDAFLDYTGRVANPSLLPSDFTLAFEGLLAFFAEPSVFGTEPGLAQRAYQIYEYFIEKAKAEDAKSTVFGPDPLSSIERARA